MNMTAKDYIEYSDYLVHQAQQLEALMELSDTYRLANTDHALELWESASTNWRCAMFLDKR